MVPSMTELAFPANHRARVEAKIAAGAPFFAEAAKRLLDRLADTRKTFARCRNVSRDGGAIAAGLPSAMSPAEEGQPCDVMLANLTLATLDDPVATLHGWLADLAPDGLLLSTTLGAASFGEFRHAFHEAGFDHRARVTPLPDVQECGILLQRLKLAMPVVDRDILTLTFPDFATLYRNLRRHGAHNYHPERQRGWLTPRQLARVEEAYRRLYPRADGRLPVTIELIYLHGWKPHASQQQPLKPGQGKVSLVKILNPT